MINYSVTIAINKVIESEWLKWMKEFHIPDVMKTGYFSDWQMQKQLLPEDLTDETTYVISYFSHSIENYQKYTEMEAPRLRDDHNKKYSGQFKATRAVYSLMSR